MFCNTLLICLNEEYVANSWIRRPRGNSSIGLDVSAELKDRNDSLKNSALEDLHNELDTIRHRISLSTDIEEIDNLVFNFDLDADSIVADYASLDTCRSNNDVAGFKRQILHGLSTWENAEIKRAKFESDNTDSLLSHPMKSVGMGRPSLKRSMAG